MMKKRVLVGLLCLLLTLSSGVGAYADGLDNFQKTRAYEGQFTDIEGRWFRDTVVGAYELGLAEGQGNGLFAGEASVKLSEAITMAARINAVYYGRSIPLSNGKWYEGYVGYAVSAGIIRADQYGDYERAATRAELARLICAALPAPAYAAVNEVDDGAIPDVEAADDAIYMLYRAGILTGYDDGSFFPAEDITRAEAFTILDRAVEPAARQLFTLKKAVTEEPGPEGPGEEEPEPEKIYFVGTQGVHTEGKVIETVLTLYPETGELYFDFGVHRTAYGMYEPDGRTQTIICLLGERHLGTLPGSDVTGFAFTYTGGTTAIRLTRVTVTGGISYLWNADGTVTAVDTSGVEVTLDSIPAAAGLGTLRLGDLLVSRI